MQLMWFGVVLFVAMVFSLLFAYFFVSAVTVPVVVQLMIAPLRPVRIVTAVAALKRRWRVFALTSLLVMTLILCRLDSFHHSRTACGDCLCDFMRR